MRRQRFQRHQTSVCECLTGVCARVRSFLFAMCFGLLVFCTLPGAERFSHYYYCDIFHPISATSSTKPVSPRAVNSDGETSFCGHKVPGRRDKRYTLRMQQARWFGHGMPSAMMSTGSQKSQKHVHIVLTYLVHVCNCCRLVISTAL